MLELAAVMERWHKATVLTGAFVLVGVSAVASSRNATHPHAASMPTPTPVTRPRTVSI